MTRTIWTSFKDSLIRAGLDPWLRPIANAVWGRNIDTDDLATRRIIASLPPDAVCVDVGCHKGLYLDPMRQQAVEGRFFAIEPIPYLYDLLKAKYRNDPRVTVLNFALSSKRGTTEFFINDTDMGLSGLSRRQGRNGIDQQRLMSVPVAMRTLDELFADQHVDFLKIDVEGAEFDVLKGAERLLEGSRPHVLFEFGLGGADYFGVGADAMFEFFEAHRYALYTAADYAHGGEPLDSHAFAACFASNSAYNFLAASLDGEGREALAPAGQHANC
jgi:FkbM family methyltransferase